MLTVGGSAVHLSNIGQSRRENMTLSVGKWHLVTNGHTGTLEIAGISNTGEITGTVTVASLPPAKLNRSAFWNEATQEIKFIVNSHPNNPETSQFYVGYLFPLSQQQAKWTLAGYLLAFEGSGGSANRSTSGWFATL
jgi:hypothetical protein